jgi:hypothetical protein
MTRVAAIEQEVQRLSPDEFSDLRDWILDQDWKRWDRRIEQDAAEGRLEPLFDRALEAHR